MMLMFYCIIGAILLCISLGLLLSMLLCLSLNYVLNTQEYHVNHIFAVDWIIIKHFTPARQILITVNPSFNGK